MAMEEMMPVETPVVGESLPPGAAAPPDAVAPVEAPNERSSASSISLTRDDIPELADVQVGDVVSLEVTEISDDGNIALSYVAPEQPMDAGLPPDEAAPVEPDGRDSVLAELTGGMA